MNRRCLYALLQTLASIALIAGCAPAPSSSTKEASTSLILATFAPRQVVGVDADGVTQFGDFDFDRLPALIEAGINEIIAPIEFMTKDVTRRYELRCQFVQSVKPYGIRYCHTIATRENNELMATAGCSEPPEDGNFVSGSLFLDEPYAYFPDWEKGFTPPADVAVVSQYYIDFVRRSLEEQKSISVRNTGQNRTAPLPSFNTLESLAWYDLEAGADGFLVEGLGGFFLQQIHFFNEYFGLEIPETPENYIRLVAAFERGAASHFDQEWGYGIYAGTPLHLRKIIMEGLYERGATIFIFWANHADGTIPTDEVISLAIHIRDYARTHTPSKTHAALAIVIPSGYHIPGGIYCSEELSDRDACIQGKGAVYSGGDLWNAIPAMTTPKVTADPRHAEILRAWGQAIKDALASDDEFDILIADESLKPGYVDRYEQVIWIGK